MNLIFDIGCHYGAFTAQALMKYPEATIVAVDMDPYNLNNLRARIGNNSKVKIVEAAVSKVEGETVGYFCTNSTTINTLEKSWTTNSRFSKEYSWIEKSVDTITLDTLIDMYGLPDIIKIDTEGYEDVVLEGLSTKVPLICFEWAEESAHGIKNSIDKLHKLGYTQFGVIGHFSEKVLNDYLEPSDFGGDAHLQEPKLYSSWENLKLFDFIKPDRKDNWGMIYAK